MSAYSKIYVFFDKFVQPIIITDTRKSRQTVTRHRQGNRAVLHII